MKTFAAAELTIWETDLPNTKLAILPPNDNRPNPLIIGSRLYVSVFSPGAVCALDRKTGKLLWRRELNALCGPSVCLHNGTLFAKTSNTLYAMDPRSGKEIWTFCPYGSESETIYSSPCVYRDHVYIGDRRGFFHCLDAKTGNTVWSRLTNRAENDDVNSTAIISRGLAVIATNAGTAVAYEARHGKMAWKTKLDGPSVSGLFLFRRKVSVLTDSVYFLDPVSGKAQQKFNWPQSRTISATATPTHVFVVIGRPTPPDSHYQVLAIRGSDVITGTIEYPMYCWLRYISETNLVYLSNMGGIDLLASDEPKVVGRIQMPSEEDVGLVDVKGRIIYALTTKGSVFALRHPSGLSTSGSSH